MRWRALASLAAAAALLAGCATTTPRSTRTGPAYTLPPPSPSVAMTPSLQPPSPLGERGALWKRLRARMQMDDCAPDPQITKWARRYTRSPQGFEARLKHDLPLIAYIADAAERHDVPAEFVFLPWVESRYRPIAPRRGRAAGMWQIMPATARTLELPVHTEYDARLDKIAATDAVMRMLAGYQKTFHDWRLVDMAFNAGQYRVRGAVKNGDVPKQPLIPQIDVARGTRQHLAKLMAMACVIREPQRFGVHLPPFAPSRRLQEVVVSTPINMRTVARLAAMSTGRVRALNPAYRYGRMPPGAPHHVLLPVTNAAAFDSAFDAAAGTLADANRASRPPPPRRYTVSAGDSLWSIAHRFGTSVHKLKRLNHLRSARLHPGQVLRLRPVYR